MQTVKEAIILVLKNKQSVSNKETELVQRTAIYNQYRGAGNCATFDLEGNLLETSARRTAKITTDYVSFTETITEFFISGERGYYSNCK